MSKKYHTDPYGVICDHDGPVHNPGEPNRDAAVRILTKLHAEVLRLQEEVKRRHEDYKIMNRKICQLQDMVEELEERQRYKR